MINLLKHGVSVFFIGASVMLGFNILLGAIIFSILGGICGLSYGYFEPKGRWHLLHLTVITSNIFGIFNYYNLI